MKKSWAYFLERVVFNVIFLNTGPSVPLHEIWSKSKRKRLRLVSLFRLGVGTLSLPKRNRVCSTLCDLYLSVVLATSDGEVNEKGEGTLRDAYYLNRLLL